MELTRTTLRPGVAVVKCDGRLNMVAAPKVRAFLDETVQQGASRLIVDLTGTTFIDSSGLGALIGGLKTARQHGGTLRIAAPNDQVRSVLQITNLDRVLHPHDQVQDASRGL